MSVYSWPTDSAGPREADPFYFCVSTIWTNNILLVLNFSKTNIIDVMLGLYLSLIAVGIGKFLDLTVADWSTQVIKNDRELKH